MYSDLHVRIISNINLLFLITFFWTFSFWINVICDIGKVSLNLTGNNERCVQWLLDLNGETDRGSLTYKVIISAKSPRSLRNSNFTQPLGNDYWDSAKKEELHAHKYSYLLHKMPLKEYGEK